MYNTDSRSDPYSPNCPARVKHRRRQKPRPKCCVLEKDALDAVPDHRGLHEPTVAAEREDRLQLTEEDVTGDTGFW